MGILPSFLTATAAAVLLLAASTAALPRTPGEPFYPCHRSETVEAATPGESSYSIQGDGEDHKGGHHHHSPSPHHAPQYPPAESPAIIQGDVVLHEGHHQSPPPAEAPQHHHAHTPGPHGESLAYAQAPAPTSAAIALRSVSIVGTAAILAAVLLI